MEEGQIFEHEAALAGFKAAVAKIKEEIAKIIVGQRSHG